MFIFGLRSPSAARHCPWSLARKAVELCPRLRVIYTTGHGQTDGMAALFVDDATFLPKPYTVKQLTETVRATAEEHPRR